MLQEETAEEIVDPKLAAEYNTWKRNSPYLYETLITHDLDHPSLTVDWLPTKECRNTADYSIQRIVIGTHTLGSEPDQLIIANVKLPLDDTTISNRPRIDNTREIGGNSLSKVENKVDPLIRINHDGEVNKARVMPKRDDIIATKSPSGNVYVYDYTKHPNRSTQGPQLILKGHQKEGFGLAWNSIQSGLLASGSDDHLICIWDISAGTEGNNTIQPLRTFSSHSEIVADVSWSEFSPNILGSVSDDKKIMLWDIRHENPTHIIEGHNREINAIDFNKFEENLLATASKDNTVAIWDIRNMTIKLYALEYHTDEVFNVRWAPFSGTMIGSSGNDRKVCLWDLSKIGDEQTEEAKREGPPELVFIHGGHCANVSDFSWNMNDHLMLASVDEDSALHIWMMANSFMSPLNFKMDTAATAMDLDKA
ncbi:unnamed protein product [Blepharisma stoltei]|uniref:Histone-binding protein RBBP4 N-terminal domain-containing protein n=1 Tax=Blepharisma stoltei TaxID=1481888 RepID=A0AAU9JTK8_9CILI|nr:unnamed protein product [Blepharisma stoltei]